MPKHRKTNQDISTPPPASSLRRGVIGILIFMTAFAVVGGLNRAFGWTAPRPTRISHASWVLKPGTVSEMLRSADVVVVGQLSGVASGRTAFSSSGEDPLQFELATFVVDEALKGSVKTVTIERVASVQSGVPTEFDHDGGRFLPRTTYLLFLRKQARTPYYIQINDEARFKVDPNTSVALTEVDGVVARALRNRRLSEIRAVLHTAAASR